MKRVLKFIALFVAMLTLSVNGAITTSILAAKDSSPSSFDLQGQGAPIVVASPLGAAFGKAISFSGADHGAATDALAAGPQLFTSVFAGGAGSVEMTVKRTRSGVLEKVAGKWAGDGSGTWLFFFGADNTLCFAMICNGGYSQLTGATITDTNPHQIQASWDGATIRLFIDGVVTQTLGFSGTTNNSAAVPCYLGRGEGTGDAFAGVIDEVRFSNVARNIANYAPANTPFVSDAHTTLLLHADTIAAPAQKLFSDSFTDANGTPLTSHVGQSGAWIQSYRESTGVDSIQSNALTVGGFTGQYEPANATPMPTLAAMLLDVNPAAGGNIGPMLDGIGVTSTVGDQSHWTGYIGTNYTGNWNIFRFHLGTLGQTSGNAVGQELIAGEANALLLMRNSVTGVVMLYVNGVSSVSLTDATPLTPGRPGFYTDGTQQTAPTTADNPRVFTLGAVPSVAFIGDSITAGLFSTHTPTVYAARAFSTGANGLPVIMLNEGISGTTTADWVVGGTDYLNARAAMIAAGCKYCFIMLGANDSKIAIATSQATYQSRMQAICDDLNAHGIKPIAGFPSYIVPGSYTNTWDASSNVLLQQYQTAILNLRGIILGDETAFNYFQANPSQLSDGVHPTDQGYRYFGRVWAGVLSRLFSGRGNGGDLGLGLGL